jgi:hypothetical protein
LRAKLTLLLGKSLHVDEQTAKFYLEDANGDVKAAMTNFGKMGWVCMGGLDSWLYRTMVLQQQCLAPLYSMSTRRA